MDQKTGTGQVTQPEAPNGATKTADARIEKGGHNPNFDLEGIKVDTPQGTYEMKRVVTGEFFGTPVEKVIPKLVSNENTLSFGDDANYINAWSDRDFLIDIIEGTPEEAGFKGKLEAYTKGQFKKENLPNDPRVREFFHDYAAKVQLAIRWNTPLDIDLNYGERIWLESRLEHLKQRRVELMGEANMGTITAQAYQNARLANDLAQQAIRRYLDGSLRI